MLKNKEWEGYLNAFGGANVIMISVLPPGQTSPCAGVILKACKFQFRLALKIQISPISALDKRRLHT